MREPGSILRWLRWIVTPVLAFLALAAWALASPVEAAPDDDYHLTSIWCANGGSDYCEPGSEDSTRWVNPAFDGVACFAQHEEVSADCQDDLWAAPMVPSLETDRGNFVGEYPPVNYALMRLIAGPDIQSSAITMRLMNAA